MREIVIGCYFDDRQKGRVFKLFTWFPVKLGGIKTHSILFQNPALSNTEAPYYLYFDPSLLPTNESTWFNGSPYFW